VRKGHLRPSSCQRGSSVIEEMGDEISGKCFRELSPPRRKRGKTFTGENKAKEGDGTKGEGQHCDSYLQWKKQFERDQGDAVLPKKVTQTERPQRERGQEKPVF